MKQFKASITVTFDCTVFAKNARGAVSVGERQLNRIAIPARAMAHGFDEHGEVTISEVTVSEVQA